MGARWALSQGLSFSRSPGVTHQTLESHPGQKAVGMGATAS